MIPNNSNNNSSEFCYLNISIIYKNFWFPDRISIILSAVYKSSFMSKTLGCEFCGKYSKWSRKDLLMTKVSVLVKRMHIILFPDLYMFCKSV